MARPTAPRARGSLAVAAACLAVALAACAGGADDAGEAEGPDPTDGRSATDGQTSSASPADPSPDPSADTSADPNAGPTPVGTTAPAASGPVDPLPRRVLDAVLAAASERSGMAAEGLTIVRAQAVTFSDGSLGCPRPGQVYTQALVDGYWVVVEADGETLDYRLGARGTPQLCEGGGTPVVGRPES